MNVTLDREYFFIQSPTISRIVMFSYGTMIYKCLREEDPGFWWTITKCR